MKCRIFLKILFLFSTVYLHAQNGYYYSRHVVLPEQIIQADPVDFKYPINYEDVKAIGMGNTQTANGKSFNAMMYNPALLGINKTTYEVLTLQVGMPPSTFSATAFMADNMAEFEEAISLKRVYDGVNAFFDSGTSLSDKLAALNQIQDGMRFTIDLVEKVIGSSDDPEKHGLSVLPGFSMQYGHWGFSLYGYGHSGFLVQQSPVLDAILSIDIPTDLSQPVEATKSLFELLGIMKSVFLENKQTFSDEVFPIAFYVSYIDMIGAVGYGYQITENFHIGGNLKIVNRRFSLDRIPVIDYNEILSKAWDNLKSDVTGITFDIGGHYRLPFGTEIGLALQNILPIKEISKSIDTRFSFPLISYDRDNQRQFIINDQGDTAMVSMIRDITLNRPFVLKVPFLFNLGIHHSISTEWDVSLDIVDIVKQDNRYDNFTGRIRIGTAYRYEPFLNKLSITPRLGLMDSRITAGLGFQFFNYVHLDGAYAFDRLTNVFAYYAQLKIGW